MLRNPAYIGQAAFGKRKVGPKLLRVRHIKRSYSVCANSKENWIYISVPSIISKDLFNVVQKQLEENRQRVRTRRRSETFLLQGLMICQRCQHAYCGNHHGVKNKRIRYFYYRCNAKNFIGSKICNKKGIRTDMLDMVVWEEVKNLLTKPDMIANEYQHKLSDNKSSVLSQTLEKQESKLKRSIAKLIDSYAQEYITQEEFEPRVKAMRQHLKEIEEQKEKMLDQKKLQRELSIVTNSLKHFSSNIEVKLDQVDWKTKQSIIRTLVKQIEINNDNIHIMFRIKELANFSQNSSNKNLHYCTSLF